MIVAAQEMDEPQVLGQPELHRETTSKTKTQTKTRKQKIHPHSNVQGSKTTTPISQNPLVSGLCGRAQVPVCPDTSYHCP